MNQKTGAGIEILSGLHITSAVDDFADGLLDWLAHHKAWGIAFGDWGTWEPRLLTLEGLGADSIGNLHSALMKSVGAEYLNVVIDKTVLPHAKLANYRAVWSGADGTQRTCEGRVHVVGWEFANRFPINFKKKVVATSNKG